MPYFIVSGFDCPGEPYTCGLDAETADSAGELVNTWAAHPTRRPIRICRIELPIANPRLTPTPPYHRPHLIHGTD